MLKFPIRILIGMLLLMPLLTATVPSSHAAGGLNLVIGRITDDPDKHYDKMVGMAEYLASELLDYGVSGVGVVMAETEAEMADLIRAGKVDILSETPLMALALRDEGVVNILMREWKKGVPQYHSVIVARKDSPVSRIRDLAGRRIAFEDAGSTSGYMLPRNAIDAAGLAMAELAKPAASVPAGKVGYFFTGSETGVIVGIHNGTFDAGAVSNLDWEDKETVPDNLRGDLHVIHKTAPVIRSTLMVRASIPVEIQERIADILENMHKSDEGKAVMKAYSKVARYDRVEGEALQGLEEADRIRKRMLNSAK